MVKTRRSGSSLIFLYRGCRRLKRLRLRTVPGLQRLDDECGGSDDDKREECSFVQSVADRSWTLWGMFRGGGGGGGGVVR
jgi:hypothetical protein